MWEPTRLEASIIQRLDHSRLQFVRVQRVPLSGHRNLRIFNTSLRPSAVGAERVKQPGNFVSES